MQGLFAVSFYSIVYFMMADILQSQKILGYTSLSHIHLWCILMLPLEWCCSCFHQNRASEMFSIVVDVRSE